MPVIGQKGRLRAKRDTARAREIRNRFGGVVINRDRSTVGSLARYRKQSKAKGSMACEMWDDHDSGR